MNVQTRDIVNHGSGKGDAPRSRFDDNYRRKFSEIKWGAYIGFVKRGKKYIKTYGK